MKNKQYLLDTNILIELMSGNPIIINKLLSIGFERCCMSAISLHDFIMVLLMPIGKVRDTIFVKLYELANLLKRSKSMTCQAMHLSITEA